MITSKHIAKPVSVLMAAVLCLCLCAAGFSGELRAMADSSGVKLEYEERLFDTSSPLSVNLLMEEEDWENMLDNAISEEYCQCDVEIGGQTFYRVGVRPKGNTSLTTIASDPETDRYSLKLEFDQYVEGQTCFALDKLVLNNHYADATYMKEALVYDMYRYLGADASLYNYAALSVNGEYKGLYLALEAVEDSFLLRNYGVSSGKLYKPESMEMGGSAVNSPGNGKMPEAFGGRDNGEAFPENGAMPDAFGGGDKAPVFPGNGSPPEGMGNGEEDFTFSGNGNPPEDMDAAGDPFGAMGGSGGANLNYIDDDLDSYSALWEGEIGSSSKQDHQRVVQALKNISQGSDLESSMDVDNLLRYAAVHMFSVNEDSLSGSMAHNYYLYEKGGQLNLLPWDYNLAFGGMHGGSASSMVNDPIDDVFSGTHFFDALLEQEEARSLYHGYLKQLVENYVNSGEFEAFYQRTRSQIDRLVETDPTAFYSYEEYEKAVDMFYQAMLLRAQSVAGQLEGSIPSTAAGQQDSSTLIDASEIDLAAMGTMEMGGRQFQDFDPSQTAEQGSDGNDTSAPAVEDGQNDLGQTLEEKPQDSEEQQSPPGDFGGQMPIGQPPQGFGLGQSGKSAGSLGSSLLLYGVCLAVLAGALVFASCFKRRSRRR